MARRLPHLTVFSFAAIHLLLFSICQVNGRIYRTKDAIVIEVDGVTPSTMPNRNSGNPPPIPMMYAVNPYTGLSYLQQPNFPFWPYNLYKPASSFSDVENVTATSADSRQQNIACGVGPPGIGNAPKDRIFDGIETVSWPFMVGLKSSEAFGIFCGGSIIAPTKILTAASCVEKLSLQTISTLLVQVGMENQGDDVKIDANPEFTKTVTRVVYHIDHTAGKKENDIAILTIDPPITYSTSVSPVCLPPATNTIDQFADKRAVVLGWGNINRAGKRATKLRFAELDVGTNEDCEDAYNNFVNFFPQRLCASAAGNALCARDIGGPLVAQLKDGSTSWTLIGVASVFQDCTNAPAQPGIYASVAFFRNWIDTNLNS